MSRRIHIKDAKAGDIPSPVGFLFEKIKSSPFAAAPERSEKLNDIMENHDIYISVEGSDKDWLLEARSLFGAEHHIKVSLRSLERLWAMCYSLTVMIAEIQKAEYNLGVLQSSQPYLDTVKQLSWFRQISLSDIEGEWPDFLPSPGNEDQSDYITHANHYFLMTIARIFLHEIAHLHLGHRATEETSPSELFRWEHDADHWADSWLFDEWKKYKDDERVFVGRSMGVAFSHSLALFLNNDDSASSTHPNPIDRIIRFIEAYLPDDPASRKAPMNTSAAIMQVAAFVALTFKGYKLTEGDLSRPYKEIFEDLRPYFA